jgi:O-antigen/teichoic acid export membrane protein
MIALNLRWMALGVQSSKAVASGNIGSQLLLAVGVLVLVNEPNDRELVPLLTAGSELLYGLVVAAVVARRFGIPRPAIRLDRWSQTIRAGLPVMGTNFARAVVYSADLFLIALMLDRSRVGVYAAAYRPVLFGISLVGLFATSFLASLSAANREQGHELFVRMARIAPAITLACALAISVAAAPLVHLVFGSAYAGAAVPLAILAWSIPIVAMTGPYTASLFAADRQAVVLRQNALAAALNVAFNLAVIPLFGIRGAAVTTVLSFATVLALNYRSAVRLGLAPRVTMILNGRPARPVPKPQL